MTDPLKPSTTLLVKLGSALVHFEEYHSETGHHWDLEAATSNSNDPEVREWLEAMNKLAFLPVKR